MKFLCVPCDSPMKLQTVAPPERGSLSVVYSCPECGYEIAMLTNAYETQIVQSLGVKIGPDRAGETVPAVEAAAKCPFAAMTQTMAGASGEDQSLNPSSTNHNPQSDPTLVRWTSAAEARLANIPEFVRPMARTGIEKFARDRGAVEIDEQILDAARDFFGM